jgi:membrane fusion protein (multidrug efflux system)
MVFVVQEGTDPTGKKGLIARQTVVTTGLTRGDQIAILSGLKEGDVVVSTGQTKLQNGGLVVVNNAILPSSDPNPQPHEN